MNSSALWCLGLLIVLVNVHEYKHTTFQESRKSQNSLKKIETTFFKPQKQFNTWTNIQVKSYLTEIDVLSPKDAILSPVAFKFLQH